MAVLLFWKQHDKTILTLAEDEYKLYDIMKMTWRGDILVNNEKRNISVIKDVEVKLYNIFHASLLIRHSNDGKMYLYDIIDIKKETSNPLES